MSAIEDVCYEMSADFAQVDCARIVNDRNLSFGLGRNCDFGRASVSAETHLSFGRNFLS